MASLIGAIIGGLFGIAVGALFTAVVVRIVTKWVAKFRPPFRMAYKASFLGGVVTYLTGFFIGFVIGASGHQFSGGVYIFLVVTGLVVHAFILGVMIKHPETGPIRFVKACLISTALTVVVAVLIGIVLIVAQMVT